MKTFKIFVASSNELEKERQELAKLANSLNNVLEPLNTHVIMVEWEDLDASMGVAHKQEEYNTKLRECEMCIVLYWSKFGIWTKQELDIAYSELRAGNNPKKLYVYFKNGGDKAPTPELTEFRESFDKNYGHFPSDFENFDTLKAHFLLQFMEYQNELLQDSKIVEVKDGKVLVGGKEYVDLANVPFAGNNEEYNRLKKDIKKTERLLAGMDTDDPEYEEYTKDLQQLQEKLSSMESNLWDTALMYTNLCNKKCSERLQQAMDLFAKGENERAKDILNEDVIERDIEHNLSLIKSGKNAAVNNIDSYKFKRSLLRNSHKEEDIVHARELSEKILNFCIQIGGEICDLTADAYFEFATDLVRLELYDTAIENYSKARDIYNALHQDTTMRYADVLRCIGRTYVLNDKLIKGEPILVEALKIVESNFGKENLIYIKGKKDLALYCAKIEKYEEALMYANEAYETFKNLQYNDIVIHIELLKLLAAIYRAKRDIVTYVDGECSIKQNDKDRSTAIEYYKEALALAKDYPIEQIRIICCLASIMEYSDNFFRKSKASLEEAENYYLNALEIARMFKFKEDESRIIKELANIYTQLGTPEKAIALGYEYPKPIPSDGKTLSQAIFERQQKKDIRNTELASEIADLYLKAFPREQSYAVYLSSSVDDSSFTKYERFDKDTLETIKKCQAIATEEECDIQEILLEENEDLVEKLLDHGSPFPLDMVDSVDLNDALKFSRFSMCEIDKDGHPGYSSKVWVPLSDDEFRNILIELLKRSNNYSMNMMVYQKPDLAQKIMRHLVFSMANGKFENWNPFACDMIELKGIVDNILNPFKDILHIFNSENDAMRQFAISKQIVPESGEIYNYQEESDIFHIVMNFEGTKLSFFQEGVTFIHNIYHDTECFEIEATLLMEKFGLNDPKEIFPYIKEHYNNKDALDSLKQLFM